MKTFFLLIISIIFMNTENTEGTLVVRISNLESAEGSILLALHTADDFLDAENAVLTKVIQPIPEGKNELEVELAGLEFSEYALAVFHDMNNNGELDTNLLGIPTEPYAFSNNPGVKWRGPKYEDARFDFSEDGQVVTLKLQAWKSR